jgi:Ca-activated chloride channel family protein
MAAERGVRVHTVGFGTRDGGPVAFDQAVIYMGVDEEALNAIAGKTQGEYFHAGSATDLQNVYKNLTAKLTLERGNTELSALFGAAAALFALVAATLSLLWVHRPSCTTFTASLSRWA